MEGQGGEGRVEWTARKRIYGISKGKKANNGVLEGRILEGGRE